MKEKRKVVIAMSGGVDSSVSAALLQRAGFDVIGVFMKFWAGDKKASSFNRCCSSESENRAREVAAKLGIPFYIFNFEKEFKKRIVDYFLKEYKAGKTPNPCVVCNKEIKFGLLLNKALNLGADYLATGHYVRLKNGKLFKGKDKEKDQSYFLWQLDQKQLKNILFPVGDYTKSQVRSLAKRMKLPVFNTPESQEVCFIPKTTNEFLKKYLKANPGNIADTGGKVIGKHSGLIFYTIGQRRGIKLSGGPFYVIAKDFKKDLLIVSKNEKDLYKKELIAKDINWISGKEPKLPLKIQAKIRYRHEVTSATIYKIQNTKYKLLFRKPQRAITPGQSVVFYFRQQLLGGGIIC